MISSLFVSYKMNCHMLLFVGLSWTPDFVRICAIVRPRVTRELLVSLDLLWLATSSPCAALGKDESRLFLSD